MSTNLATQLPNPDEITIRPAAESDRDRVIRIISEIFREDVSERYDWLYRGNPHGRALSWLAFDGRSSDPVGITSMFPRKVLVDGRIRLGAIGGDCYVMPSARRQGLATRLHDASFRDMRAMGVEFMYGPPWPKNLKALVKAGSTEVALYRRYARPLTHQAVSASMQAALPPGMRNAFSGRVVAGLSLMPHWMLDCLRKHHPKSCAIEPVTRFGDEWAEFLDRAARSYPVCCVRDPEYLNWRYIQGASPARIPYGVHHGGKLIGLIVLEKYGQQMIVVDMLTMADSSDTGLTLRLAMHPGSSRRLRQHQLRNHPDCAAGTPPVPVGFPRARGPRLSGRLRRARTGVRFSTRRRELAFRPGRSGSPPLLLRGGQSTGRLSPRTARKAALKPNCPHVNCGFPRKLPVPPAKRLTSRDP